MRQNLLSLQNQVIKIREINNEIASTLSRIKPMVRASNDTVSNALNVLDNSYSSYGPISTFSKSRTGYTDLNQNKIDKYKMNDSLYKEYENAVAIYQKNAVLMQDESGNINQDNQYLANAFGEDYKNLVSLSEKIKDRIDNSEDIETSFVNTWAASFDNVQKMISNYEKIMNYDFEKAPKEIVQIDGQYENESLRMNSEMYSSILWGIVTVVIVFVTVHFTLFRGYSSRNKFVIILIICSLLFVLRNVYLYISKKSR